MNPPFAPRLKSKSGIIAAGLLLAQGLSAAGFTKAEWDNPAQAGSSIWIRNAGAKPLRIETFFVRDYGIHKYDEIAMKAGASKRYFKITPPVRGQYGQWARLTPVDGKAVRLRIPAKDSLLIQGFEYGNRLRAKKDAKVLADQYVLELKVVDNTGDSSAVKISQTADSFYIGMNGTWTESDPEGD